MCIWPIFLTLQLGHDLVIDDASIRVINGTMTTKKKLGMLVGIDLVVLQQFPEFVVRVDHVRDTFGRIETRNLDKVLALRPLKYIHLLLPAQIAEHTHVVHRVPGWEMFIETVQKVGGSSQKSQFLLWYIRRDEFGHRMT
jgi:hypothetical protein